MLEQIWRSLWRNHSNGRHVFAGRAHAQEQAELELLYRTAPIGMCLVDAELNILRLNERFAEFLGVPGKDVRGRSLREHTPKLMDQVEPYCRQVFRTGMPLLDCEVTESLRDAELSRCWIMNFTPLSDSQGQVWAVSATVQDVTARKKHEQELARANQRVSDVLESISDGFVLFDDEWRFRYVNRNAALMLHTTVEKMLGELAIEFFPDGLGSIFAEKFEIAKRQKTPSAFEAYYQNLNASYKCHCYPQDDGLSVFFVDTTQNQKTIERLRKSESESRRLAAIVEQCNDFVGMCTKDGQPLYINRAGRELLGLEPDEDITGSHFLSYFSPADHVAMTSIGIPALEREGRWKGAISFRNVRTGEEIPSHWNVFVIEDPDGELPEVWGTVSPDLSEHKRLEQALRDSEQLALQANVAKSEFLANMSHEIRTPMAAILGYADILLGHLKDPDNQTSIQVIKRNGEHLLDIINDILDLSRIEAGKLEVELLPCELPQFIADIESLMHVRAANKHLDLNIAFDGRIPRDIVTDSTRLRQILINLIGNSIKFTDRGEVQLLTRYIDSVQPAIQFQVKDSGIGMSPEQQSKLYQPFTQGDSSVTRAFGGSGLGLAISKRLVEMLQGTIILDSTLGVGSCFTVTLPIARIAGLELVDPRESLPIRESVSLSKPRRLRCRALVVDDRRDVRYISQHFLEAAGARVSTAEDGELAVAEVHRAIDTGEAYDIIVLDMQMPNVDGYQAATALRACGIEQPIIALTADVMKGDRERCLKSGCDDYITKPIQHEAFVEMVAKYTQDVTIEDLRRRRRRQALVDPKL